MTLKLRAIHERCGMCHALPGELCRRIALGDPLDWTHLQPSGLASTEIPPEHRALSSGRLATDHEGMARAGRVARAREAIESAIPGFCAAWDKRERRRKSRALTPRGQGALK